MRLLNRSTGRLFVATVVLVGAACHHQTSPFNLVKGTGYEGAIIPADLVPVRYTDRAGTAAWTPTIQHVADFERALQMFLRSAATHPEVKPRIGSIEQDFIPDATDIGRLLARLPDMLRQYIGLESCGHQRMVVFAFPRDSDWSDWRERVIDGGFDNGCGVWYAGFDLERHTVTSFNCQGFVYFRPNPVCSRRRDCEPDRRG
jgi:hypothetical protein